MLKFFFVGLLGGLALALSPFLKYQSFLKDASFWEAPLFSFKNKTQPLGKNTESFLPLPFADVFLASDYLLPTFPIRHWGIPEVKIQAKTALVLETSQQEILYKKNDIHQPSSIASLTKLMTGLVVLENAKPDEVFTVSQRAVETAGEMGDLRPGEKLTVKTLLYALLLESSNDAAQALAENIASRHPGQSFVDLMNTKAKVLELKNTLFVDPSGLDPQNQSSAWDLAKLMQEMLKWPVFQEISQTAVIDLPPSNGRSRHFINTNKLLGRLPDILAGKTGYTEEAGNCMILAVKSPYSGGAIISVVINAPDRLAETEMLVKWTKEAFIW